MSTVKAKDLSKIGYTNDQARSLVINIISKHFKHHSREEVMALLAAIKDAQRGLVGIEGRFLPKIVRMNKE